MSKLKTYATHFASIGGACAGLESAGLKCVSAIELEQKRLDIREINIGHKGTCMSMRDYVPDKKDAADILWTSPPCTMLSTASREYADPDHPGNTLYLESLNYCKKLKPKYFILENVTGLLTHKDTKGRRTLRKWIEAFNGIGYKTEFNVLNSKFFGIPQDRERVFIVGSLEGKTGLIPYEPRSIKVTFGDIQEHGTVKECWSDHTYMTVIGSIARNSARNSTPYGFRFITSKENKESILKAVSNEARVDLKTKILDIMPTITCSFDGGATRKKIGIIDKKDGITYLRQPTIREGTRAQGFPDSWKLPESTSTAWQFVGDAVSSPVAEAIARHLIDVEDGKNPRYKDALTAKRIASYVKELHNDILEDIPDMKQVKVSDIKEVSNLFNSI